MGGDTKNILGNTKKHQLELEKVTLKHILKATLLTVSLFCFSVKEIRTVICYYYFSVNLLKYADVLSICICC